MSPEAAINNITPLPWTPTVSYGTRLRLIRLEYGERCERRYTQDQFAELLKVSPSSYRQWEAGNNKPADPMDLARRIYKVTGANPAWLCDVLLDPTRGDGPEGGPTQAESQSRCTVLDFRPRTNTTHDPLDGLAASA
jgi:transcriptional regulator with XRE-family HTH domain